MFAVRSTCWKIDSGGELLHTRALAMGDGDQPDIGERLHGLAYGGAADAEAVHQVAFGRHGVARRQLAAGDHRLQAIEHLMREFPSNDGLRDVRHPRAPAA